MLSFCCKTDKGSVRPNNEDSFIYRTANNNPENFDIQFYGSLFTIADGMGGHFAGEVASKMACDYVLDYYRISDISDDNTWEKLKGLFFKINEIILRRSFDVSEFNGMGTTLTTLIIRKNKAWVSHVGDSRVYLIRNEEMTQISYDHTEIQRLIDQGLFTKQETERSPARNILTQAIGVDNRLSVFTWAETIQQNDMFLLCSDGLYDMMTDDHILSIIKAKEQHLEKTCKQLIDEAINAGSKDNISVILVKIN